MTGPNPYAVADTASSPGGTTFGIQEGSGWTSGAGIIDSGHGTVTAICDGNWVDAALSGVALVLDAAATAADPLGSALAAGIGWVIDHLNPIKGWFEEVAGNPGGAIAQAQTWGLISTDLTPTAQDWSASAGGLISPQSGPAVTAYLGWQDVHTQAISALAGVADAMKTGITIAAGITGFVHGFLRDVLAQLVGAALSWVAEAFLSFGTLIPWICGQIATRVAAVTAKCSTFVTGLARSGSRLGDLLGALSTFSGRLLRLLDRVKTNPSLHRPTPRHAGPPGAPPDIPPFTVRPPDGWSPGGRHELPQPSFPEHMGDAVRGGIRDTPHGAATTATDAGKNAHEAGTDPDE